MTADVLARLIELQHTRTDSEMGKALGVSRSHWAHIKAERRSLTWPIIRRAVRAFPEIREIVLRDLAEDAERCAV